ncbi:MAG: hypothetical protein KAX30_04480 [Candidatus Atribacteria bacterium]|nr:hypothetical protein [Candidatus Atribacteria bacterium]
MSLNAATTNTLKALYSSMDKDELNESLDLLMDEALKREWELNESVLPTSTLVSVNSEPIDKLAG